MISNHETANVFGLAAVALVLSGCSADNLTSPIGFTQQSLQAAPDAGTGHASAVAATGIGSACSNTDGWQAPKWASVQVQVGSNGETLLGPQAAPTGVVLEPLRLPVGVKYCDTDHYANGYWTQTCKSNTDCPSGSACLGPTPDTVGSCRRICGSDNDCIFAGAPTGEPLCASSAGNPSKVCAYVHEMDDDNSDSEDSDGRGRGHKHKHK